MKRRKSRCSGFYMIFLLKEASFEEEIEEKSFRSNSRKESSICEGVKGESNEEKLVDNVEKCSLAALNGRKS